ncbi:MAG: xylulose kinase, partial [Microcoleus sp. SIO2G3]|nr:xylulose kinase [Microcoleus sp. SIO2G3]
PQWQQLLANVLQVPLHSMTVAAASAQGAAMLAGMSLGLEFAAPTVDRITLPQAVPELETAWLRFCQLYPRLRGFR